MRTMMQQLTYEVGDEITVQSATETYKAEVETVDDDIKRGRSGFTATVTEIVHMRCPSVNGTEVGDCKWGYDSNITEVNGQ